MCKQALLPKTGPLKAWSGTISAHQDPSVPYLPVTKFFQIPAAPPRPYLAGRGGAPTLPKEHDNYDLISGQHLRVHPLIPSAGQRIFWPPTPVRAKILCPKIRGATPTTKMDLHRASCKTAIFELHYNTVYNVFDNVTRFSTVAVLINTVS